MNHRLAAAAALACLLAGAPTAAQTDLAAPAPRTQAISVLPLHAAFGFYAGDYERAVSPTVTAGVAASYFSWGDGEDELRYSSLEARVRHYPSADPLNGLSFGLTFGPTLIEEAVTAGAEEEVTAMGVGFEVARSHTVGVARHLYFAYGGGFKRLFPLSGAESGAETTLPILRLSVGYAF